MADIKSTLPVSDAADGVDGSSAPALSAQIAGKDGSGNLQSILTDVLGRIKASDVLDTAAVCGAASVGTTVIEVKVGASRLSNRKVIIVQPTNGTIYWSSSSSVTAATGMPVFANQNVTLSVSDNIPIYAVAGSGSINVIVFEGS